MKCKTCGKVLIGKEKLFCKSCRSKGMDKAKKGAMVIVGVIGLVLLAKNGNIADVLKGGSKDL